jgi:hypothetical protein
MDARANVYFIGLLFGLSLIYVICVFIGFSIKSAFLYPFIQRVSIVFCGFFIRIFRNNTYAYLLLQEQIKAVSEGSCRGSARFAGASFWPDFNGKWLGMND